MSKKILVGVLAVVIICSFSTSLYANEDIKLEVNGHQVTDSLSYQLVEEDILIPVQMLTKALPIKMKWFNSIKTLRLQLKDKIVKLREGDENLQVNDELIQLPVATKRVNGELMVPLKTLGRALGLVIKSNPKDKVVKVFQIKAKVEEVNYCQNDNYHGIGVTVSQKVESNSDFLQQPSRITLDLKGTALYKKLDQLEADSDLIKEVRVAQFNGNTVRVVVDLQDRVDYKIVKKQVEDKYQYLIKMSPIITDLNYKSGRLRVGSTASITASEPNYLSNPQRIAIDLKNAVLEEAKEIKIDDSFFKQIRVSQYQTEPNNIVRVVFEPKKKLKIKTIKEDAGLKIKAMLAELKQVDYQSKKENQIVFNLSNRQQPEVVPLTDGDRLILDFPNTTNRFDKEEIQVDNQLIEEIRVAQFDKSTTRVVIDLKELVPYQLKWVDNQLQLKLMNRLQAVKVEDIKTQSKISLSLLTTGTYQVYKLENPKRLVVDLSNTVIDQEAINLIDNSAIVSKIRYSQYSTDPYNVRVVLDLTEDVNLIGKDKSKAKETEFRIARNNLAGKRIVVDPGHGGYDPGALGARLREKDINLDIGLALRDILEQAGAKVIMTREKDREVSLDERTDLANKLGADIFVSIHINSHQTKEPFGTETFVGEEAENTSYLLAHFVQDSLAKELDTYDRGTKSEDLYVLRNSNMPSILAEVAFISNPEEEELLSQPESRMNAAVGLYKGISKYFKLSVEEEF
ncbi:hypothetical protein JCM16358_20700 [Halanaerocella petrolearia]